MSLQKALDGLTIEKAIEIQAEQLKHWKSVLKPNVYAALKAHCDNRNEKATHGKYVFRGSDMDNFVANYKPSNMLTLKDKKETAKELAHTELWYNSVYLGYVIKNNSFAAKKGENWNFVSKHASVKNAHAKTKNGLIELVSSKFKR